MPVALIVGITGQSGSYLAEHLLKLGYEVHGLIRRASTFNTSRIEHLYKDPHDPEARLKLHYGDLTDASSLARVLRLCKPDEVYNLGAQSHVRVSFDVPEYTADATAMGAVRLIEAIRECEMQPRYFQASSSEMFGSSPPPQNESTIFRPRSPYACAKAHAYYATVNAREAYGLHASNGIMFNMESPRRSPTFVTRKVTQGAARIKFGMQDKLFLGNLDAERDWGFAGDYVVAMHRMLLQKEPGDYVIATGESHTVRELLDEAFGRLELDWRGYVEVDPKYFRPSEVDALRGDASKAKGVLGWEPKVKFKELVRMMVEADFSELSGGLLP